MAMNIFDRAMGAAWRGAKSAMGEKATLNGVEVDVIVQTYEVGSRVNDANEYGGRMRTGGAEVVMSLADWEANSGQKGSMMTLRGIDMKVVNIPSTSGMQVTLQLSPS